MRSTAGIALLVWLPPTIHGAGADDPVLLSSSLISFFQLVFNNNEAKKNKPSPTEAPYVSNCCAN
jgi:hypothetical protein